MYYILDENNNVISSPQYVNHRGVKRVKVDPDLVDTIEDLRGPDGLELISLSDIQDIDSTASLFSPA